MSRNLILCCDGTNNQFGSENTSIVRLVQSAAHDAEQQLVYYDPGVGTLPEPGVVTKTGKMIAGGIGLAFGGGLTRNVEKAYAYLIDFWEPGDSVFLFGFSRGAYTVRVLAGLLHALGLLPRGSNNMVPYVMRLFKSVRGDGRSNYWRLCNQFRRTFARPVPGSRFKRFRIHFLGVWDTVSSVGWAWDPIRFPYTAKNPSVETVRHAVSIDERRWFFRQNLMQPARGQDLKELWFPGVHSDVGGGYPEDEGGLWRLPFDWILSEAQKCGLIVDEQGWKRVLERRKPPERPWAERRHESLQGVWWLAELFPKLQGRAGARRRLPRIGLGRRRFVPEGALISKPALLRIRDPESNYAPPNLSPRFLSEIRSLEQVPELLPYRR